jgi:hypothetical protein
VPAELVQKPDGLGPEGADIHIRPEDVDLCRPTGTVLGARLLQF